MFADCSFYLLMGITVLMVTACTPSERSNPVDRFVGTWTGSMSITADPTVSAVAMWNLETKRTISS